MEKKNKGLITLVIILSLLVVGLGGFIVYDKVLSDYMIEDNKINNENNNITYNVNDYVVISSVNLNDENKKIQKVLFNNIDNNLVKEFLLKQNQFIEEAKKNDVESSSEIWYQINGNILSVYYKLSMYLDFCLGIKNEIAVINIDLSNMKLVSNNQLLKLGNTSLKNIAIESYNRILVDVEECSSYEYPCGVLDKDQNVIKLDDYKNNKDEIVSIIEAGVDKCIYSYIQDGIIKYDYIPMFVDGLYINIKSGCPNFVTVSVGNFK